MNLSPPPVSVLYDPWAIACFLLTASFASYVALDLVRRARAEDGRLAWRWWVGGSLTTGAGISAIYEFGITVPGISWNGVTADTSVVVAIAVSAIAIVTLVVLMLSTSYLAARVRARTSGLDEKLRKADAQLRRRAVRDSMTGLPNRALFERRLAEAVKRLDAAKEQGRDGGKIVALFIALDGVKPVNHALGHAAGDLVLKEVAQRLRASVRAGDTVARLGSDEFVLLMECETALVDPAITARRIVESVGTTLASGAGAIQLSCAVGIATYPQHGPQERLVAHAIAAMHDAQRAGGNTWAHFEARPGAVASPRRAAACAA